MRHLYIGLAAILMAGCSTLGQQMTQKKLDELQLPLSTLPDGARFIWKTDVSNRGDVTIVNTFSKNSVVCRLVEEDEMVNGVQDRAVSTYCLSRGSWR